MTFSLQLYPKYGQDPISVTYRFDITNCRSSQASFYVRSHPSQLVLDKEHGGAVINKNFYPTYHNLFYTSRSNCNIKKLEILNTSL